ncbi:unnamed protein product (mitochondrion) [Plasmodiophora brassicae]|uniref:Uncharacterized protein n=2 Tax=Plasmodiophora brassicae TaxID=37360 RepID=A0A3P3Y2Q8_PLABS|nr:unnamed protein product [Plasmodiophora brassicae]
MGVTNSVTESAALLDGTVMKDLLRHDRGQLDLRELSSEQGVLDQSDGSARFNHGQTSVIASVVGPVEAPLRLELVDRAAVSVVVKSLPSWAPSSVAELELLVRQTLEPIVLRAMHPRTQIAITLHIVEDAGSLLAACVNAACLALVDAGVPCSAMATGVSFAISRSGNVLLDPTLDEEHSSPVRMTFVFSTADQNMLTSATDGLISEDAYFKCAEVARQGAARVQAFTELTLRSKVNSKP